jgi:hypothetical protein
LASIFKLFEDATSQDIKLEVKEMFQAKNCIVEHIADKKTKSSEEDDLNSIL